MSAPGVAGGVDVPPDDFECCSKRVPEPFTHYPKHPTADDVYFIDGAWAPAAITAVDKRFSDAELMACHWEAAFDVREAEIMGRTEWLKKRLWEALTLHRFATLPHATEEPT